MEDLVFCSSNFYFSNRPLAHSNTVQVLLTVHVPDISVFGVEYTDDYF